jgi:hypothetical protein
LVRGLGGVDVQQSGLQRWGLGMTGGSRPLARMIPDGQGLEDQPADGFGRLAGIQPVEGDRGSDGAPDLPLNQAERWCSRALEARRMLSAYVRGMVKSCGSPVRA